MLFWCDLFLLVVHFSIFDPGVVLFWCDFGLGVCGFELCFSGAILILELFFLCVV